MHTIPVSRSPSVDGVPFLMRDSTLRRTTDVEKIFPDRHAEDASFFNWTDLRQLSAGQWFLEVEKSLVEWVFFISSDIYVFGVLCIMSCMIVNVVIYARLSPLLKYDPNLEKMFILASLPKQYVSVSLCCQRRWCSLREVKVPFPCHDC